MSEVAANEFGNEVDLDLSADNAAFKTVVAVIGLVLVIAIGLIGYQKWQTDQMVKQLPGIVVVEDSATLVDYIVGNGDNDDRLRLAIFAAERMKRPLSAVETEVAGRDKPLLGENYRYGTVVPVTYDRARSLVAYSDSVKISMLIYPGDLLDPKRGVFISRNEPEVVIRYVTEKARPCSYEQRAATIAFVAANPSLTVVTRGCAAGPAIVTRAPPK